MRSVLAKLKFHVGLLQHCLLAGHGRRDLPQLLEPLLRHRRRIHRSHHRRLVLRENSEAQHQNDGHANTQTARHGGARKFPRSFAELPGAVDLEHLAVRPDELLWIMSGAEFWKKGDESRMRSNGRGLRRLPRNPNRVAREVDRTGPGRRLDQPRQLVQRIQVGAGPAVKLVEQFGPRARLGDLPVERGGTLRGRLELGDLGIELPQVAAVGVLAKRGKSKRPPAARSPPESWWG